MSKPTLSLTLSVCVVHLIHFQIISPDLSSHARWKWFPAFVLPCVTSLSKEKHSHLWLSHLFFSLSWQTLNLIIQDYYVPVAGNPACVNVLRVLLESCYETAKRGAGMSTIFMISWSATQKSPLFHCSATHVMSDLCSLFGGLREKERAKN